MRRAEPTSAFWSAPARRAGPFDLGLVGRDLDRLFSASLSEPVPDEWQALIERLDDRGAFAERRRREVGSFDAR